MRDSVYDADEGGEPVDVLSIRLKTGETIRDLFRAMIEIAWKRIPPTPRMDCYFTVVDALIRGGAISGTFTHDGFVNEFDPKEVDQVIFDALNTI